jgi:flagellar assembly factor FliW
MRSEPQFAKSVRVYLPGGLIGLSDLREFELLADPESGPFLLLRALEPDPIEFVAIELDGILPDYCVEIGEEDAGELGLSGDGSDAWVLNIATVKSWSPQRVTANLVAPLVVNRKTGVGKQVVLTNYQRYSVNHPLIDDAA